MSKRLIFNWVENPSPPSVVKKWLELSNKVQPSLFLTTDWISSWLDTFNRLDWLLEVRVNEVVVALGLFCESYHKRPLGFHALTLHLNMTGSELEDQIWPEYNGLLCLPEYKEQVTSELLSNLFSVHRSIDEFDAGLAEASFLNALNTKSYVQDVQLETNSYLYEAESQSVSKSPYSASLKRQLKRTKRMLDEQGDVYLEFEFNRDAIKMKFNEMSLLHKRAWGSESGFNNDNFVRFHATMIQKDLETVKPVMASLIVAGELYARHFIYISNAVAYFYMGVTNKNTDNRIKSGLLLHAETINRLPTFKCNRYDFLGGDYAYKKRFSNNTIPLKRIRIKRSNTKFKLESLLKRLKNFSSGNIYHA